MPVAGLVRLRKHQFARQPDYGNKVAATRAYPFRGVPDVDLGWTDPEVDAGTIDITAAPEREGGDFTASLTDNALEYNTIPMLMAGFFGGDETPTGAGTAKTWTHDPASTTVDELDPFVYEFGDDVTTDWFQLGDGVLETLEITAPEGLGALTTSMGWRFGSASSTGSTDSPVEGTVPTPGLAVDTTGVKVYLKDCAIFIASSVAGLGAGQVSDALHSFVMRFSGDLDLKRWANGDQSFDIDAIARATRLIEVEAIWSKTADIVGTGSEADAWFSDEAVNRYVRFVFTSTVEAQAGIPYSWTVTLPLRYYTRSDGESGGNSTVTLTGRAFYDPDDFTGVFTSVVVNTLTDAQLGLAVS